MLVLSLVLCLPALAAEVRSEPDPTVSHQLRPFPGHQRYYQSRASRNPIDWRATVTELRRRWAREHWARGRDLADLVADSPGAVLDRGTLRMAGGTPVLVVDGITLGTLRPAASLTSSSHRDIP